MEWIKVLAIVVFIALAVLLVRGFIYEKKQAALMRQNTKDKVTITKLNPECTVKLHNIDSRLHLYGFRNGRFARLKMVGETSYVKRNNNWCRIDSSQYTKV